MEKNTCESGPEFTRTGTQVDFFIPHHCCPDKIEQPQFTSPTSCTMSQEQFEELEANIARSNQILLDLALSGRRDDNQIFQSSFDGLVGKNVKIILDCPPLDRSNDTDGNSDKIELIGKVFIVGFDFVVIKVKGVEKKEIIIPYEHIQKIKLTGRRSESLNEEDLINIDPCLRRNITFHFGKTVSSSPELIQIFFRLRLSNYLLLFLDKKVKIRFENKLVKDSITDINYETVSFCSDEHQSHVSINNICYIVVSNKNIRKLRHLPRCNRQVKMNTFR